MRKITIFATKGSDKRVINSEATTWGELKSEILEHYDLDNLQATENINRTDLSSSKAILPTTDFNLFLRPIKTKSGARTYQEARRIIQNNEDLKEYIKEEYGLNYTNLSTADLNDAIEDFYEGDVPSVRVSAVIDNSNDESIEKIKEIVQELSSNLEDFLFRLGGLRPNYGATEDDYEEDFVDEEILALEKEAREIFGED